MAHKQNYSTLTTVWRTSNTIWYYCAMVLWYTMTHSNETMTQYDTIWYTMHTIAIPWHTWHSDHSVPSPACQGTRLSPLEINILSEHVPRSGQGTAVGLLVPAGWIVCGMTAPCGIPGLYGLTGPWELVLAGWSVRTGSCDLIRNDWFQRVGPWELVLAG